MNGYYFEIERHGGLIYAYVWREEDATTAPPVMSFHAHRSALGDEEAERQVSNQAAQWIKKNGIMV